MAKLADAYNRVGGTCHGVHAGRLCRRWLCREKFCRRVVSTTTQASTFPRPSHLARCPAYTLPLPTAILHVLLWCVQVIARMHQEKGAGAASGQLPEVLLHNRLMMVKVQRAMEAGGA